MGIGIMLGILIVAALAGSIGAYAYFFYYKKQYMDKKKVSTIALVPFVVVMLVAFVLVPFGFQQVNVGYKAVETRFGEVVGVRTQGLHFINIISNRLIKYDLRTQQIDIRMDAHTEDAQPFSADLTIHVSVKADQLIDIANQFGDLDTLLARFHNVAMERAKIALVDKTAMELIQQRGLLPQMILSEVRALEAQFMLNVESTALHDIRFTRAFMEEIERQMIAEQEIVRARLEAQRLLIEAQARLDAARLEKEIIVVQAQADAEAIRVMMMLWDGFEWNPLGGVASVVEDYEYVETLVNPTHIYVGGEFVRTNNNPTHVAVDGGGFRPATILETATHRYVPGQFVPAAVDATHRRVVWGTTTVFEGEWVSVTSGTDLDALRELMLQQMIIEQWDGRLPEVLIGSDFLEMFLRLFGTGSGG